MSLKADLRSLVDDFRDKHEERVRVFRHKDIPFHEISPEGITDGQKKAVLMAMLVESFIPVYTEYLSHINRFREPLDEFSILWAREELMHFTSLRSALLALGMPGAEIEAQVRKVRTSRNWQDAAMSEGPFGPLKTAIYPLTNTTIQEKSTEIFYRSLADAVEDPVITQVLKLLATDEARHHQFMFEALKLHLEHEPRGKLAAMRAIAEYEMPGYYLLENWHEMGVEAAEAAQIDQKAAYKQIKEKLLPLVGVGGYAAGALMVARRKLVKPPTIRHSTDIRREKK